MSTDPATDRANFIDLQRGVAAALDSIIARWQRPLLGFAFRYVQNSADAQDLVAETFVRLYQRRMSLRQDTSLSAWLFTTLSNQCHNHYRWKRRHPTVCFDAPESDTRGASEPAALEAGPDAALERDESVAALRKAIEALSHDLKVAVILHHYERLSYSEIAAVTSCSERGVETRLYRARRLLRERLGEFLHETSPR